MSKMLYSLLFIFFLSLSCSSYASGTYGARICKTSVDLTCYVVKRGDSWEKLFSNADTQDYVKHLNRTSNSLRKGMTIAVPKDLSNLNLMNISPFALQISPPGEKIIYVSLTTLAWGAYDSQGNLLRWGPVSGSKGYCPDIHSRCTTPLGKFAIYRKQGASCISHKFPVGRGGAPMPYCMFFKGGFAMHGSYDVPGYNASHGCIRLVVSDAKWLNEEFVGDEEVPVIVSKDP